MGVQADRPIAAGPRGPLFWSGVAAGWALILAGAAGMVAQARFAKPVESAIWIVGAAVVHDGVLAPVVIAAARGLRRVVPGRVLPAVQATLVTLALVAGIAAPIYLGLGRRADNASLLPRNYAAGIGITLGAIVAVGSALAVRAARSRPPAGPGGPGAA